MRQNKPIQKYEEMSQKRNQIRNDQSKETKGGRGKKKQKDKDSEKEKTDGKTEQYFDDIIVADENNGKDFELLMNAPISEDDHFVFKSEKDWNVDISKYAEFFTLDLKLLSAAIESLPFDENVNIDTKYFTEDQLTNIYNNTEQGKEKYNKILCSFETKISNDIQNSDEGKNSQDDTMDNLDFLLSLQEPINNLSLTVNSLPSSCNADSKTNNSMSEPNSSTKLLDLETWLDSVLDD